MLRVALFAALVALCVSWCIAGCTQPSEEVLRSFPLDGTQDLITQSGVELDSQRSSDGHGSIRLDSSQPTTFRLFEVENLQVEDARLVYRARLRTENVEGRVYLEMWCAFDGRGEYFSRALHAPLSGTNEWTTQETPFFLEAGQTPRRVKLNVVVEGAGTVWVDDLVLAKGPLS